MEKIIARQLIKKTDTSEIMGYELLVQSDAESLYNSSVDSAAANAMTAFLTENSSKIFRDRKTFMLARIAHEQEIFTQKPSFRPPSLLITFFFFSWLRTL